jgi:hypothetical protein
MGKPETTACWYRRGDKWIGGLFHQWGVELGPVEGEDNYTVGIVEDSNSGKIFTPMPTEITFGAIPLSEL